MAVSLDDLGAFVGLASFVLQLGENYYRASDAVKQFKLDVELIARRCQEWEEQRRKYGLSLDKSLQDALDGTQEELKKEKARLEHLRKRWIRRFFFKVRGTAFPLQVGQRLQRLLELDQRILQDWRADEVREAEAQKRAAKLVSSPTFTFRRDNRYVRLPDIEGEIRRALEGSAGNCIVVLLHGPPGTGKSCMARHLALEYKERTIRTTSAAESSPESSSEIHAASFPESSLKHMTTVRYPFEKVLFLECGEKVDSNAKQREMLVSLGWKDERLEPKVGATEEGGSREVESEINYSRLLKLLLKERRILIILDDIWQKTFVEDIEELCGQNVKILVTSQSSRLCDHSSLEHSVTYISMDRITKEAARDILKVHAGVRLQDQILRPIQECMDILADKVSLNPHALASIATAIDYRRAHQLAEWKNAIYEYDNILATESTLSMHGKSYPSSFYKSIEIKFHRLNEQEKKLIMLLAMLQGPSIIEPVIQLLFNELVAPSNTTLRRSSMLFSKCRGRLEDLQCIKIEEVEINLNSWSIHFLDNQHVQKTMKDEMHSMYQKVASLSSMVQGLEREPQVHYIKILGALYLGEQWGKAIADDLSFLWREFNAATRNAIQPIISLMMQNVDEHWTTTYQNSADQVFISFLVDGVIHEEAAKILKSSPISKIPVLVLPHDLIMLKMDKKYKELKLELICFLENTRGSEHAGG